MTGLISRETWGNTKTVEDYKSAISMSTLGKSGTTEMLLSDRAAELARLKLGK